MANRLRRYWWVGVCAGLLVLYAAMAWSAVSGKGATYDEPLSVVSAWGIGRLGDYRVDYEHPPLWKKWAWLGNRGREVRADLTSEHWRVMGEQPMSKWDFTNDLMYKQSGNDPCGLVRRSRGMMLAVAVMGGAVIGWWAWGMGGGVAAVVAVGLFALDPNFLGHGPLVKNDVSIAVVATGIFGMTWLLGRRVTWVRALGLAVLCGVALVVKLSAVVLGPIVAALLVGRAVWGGPWRVMEREVLSRGRRVAAAVGVCALALAVSYGVIWAAYGFRYGASPDEGFRVDMREIVRMGARKAYHMQDPKHLPTERELATWDPGLVAQGVMRLNEWHALPEAWLAGVLFTERTAIGAATYLNGWRVVGGTWYYFLEAMAVKTPVGTVIGVLLAVGWWVGRKRGEAWRGGLLLSSWDTAVWAVPVGVLVVGSFFTELNLGVRYMLPVYPLLFVAVGVAAGRVWGTRLGRVLVVLVGISVAAESLWAYPNYIAFFNWPSGGATGGIGLLGDSNLDWGQDLPAVAEWQRRHSGEELYLCYFGMEDPAAWGIRCHTLPGGYSYGGVEEWPARAGDVMMVSATNLQRIYYIADAYGFLRGREPEEVLNGTVYVYRATEADVRR